MIASDPQHRPRGNRRCWGCALVLASIFWAHGAQGQGPANPQWRGGYPGRPYVAVEPPAEARYSLPPAYRPPEYAPPPLGSPGTANRGMASPGMVPRGLATQGYGAQAYGPNGFTPTIYGPRRATFSQLAFQDPVPAAPMNSTPMSVEPMTIDPMGDSPLEPQPLPEPNSEEGESRSGEAGRVSEAERLGTEPESNNLAFLRRQTVLLEPGQWQYDIGFNYSLSQNQFPVALTSAGNVVGVAGANVRQRLITCPFEVRLGVLERLQVFMSMPVGFSGTQLAFSGFDESENIFGAGDLRTGMTVLLKKGKGCVPDVIGTFDMTFPTGNDNFLTLGLFPGAQLGEGFFALAASVLAIHTYDPVVVFYGGGYRHRFDDPSLGFDIDPGEQFFYQLGVGFAVNERVTFSASFLGLYITHNELDGERLDGSNQEPIRMRFSVTVLNPDRCLPTWRGTRKVKEIIEPFAEIGLTQESPETRFGIVWTY